MQTYISLLRGINVGGHRKILMADLKASLVKAGFSKVITYIQSGNIILQSQEKNAEAISKKVSEIILETFSFEVPVRTYTAKEWKHFIEKVPFSDPKEKKVHAVFLPSPERGNYEMGNDICLVEGNVAYLYCKDGTRNTKFTPQWFDKKFGKGCTARNWNTLLALEKLSTQ